MIFDRKRQVFEWSTHLTRLTCNTEIKVSKRYNLKDGPAVTAPFILHSETAKNSDRKKNYSTEDSQNVETIFQHSNLQHYESRNKSLDCNLLLNQNAKIILQLQIKCKLKRQA